MGWLLVDTLPRRTDRSGKMSEPSNKKPRVGFRTEPDAGGNVLEASDVEPPEVAPSKHKMTFSVIGDDNLSASLTFLDLRSLLRVEVSGKAVRPAVVSAWVALDAILRKREEKSEAIRADGETPRLRVIRSSAEYRRRLLEKYAMRVENMDFLHYMRRYENMKPFDEPLYYTLPSEERKNVEFYIRFSRQAGTEQGKICLAHGLVPVVSSTDPDDDDTDDSSDDDYDDGDDDDDDDDDNVRIEFDLNHLDLSNFASMRDFLSMDETAFGHFMETNNNDFEYPDLVENVDMLRNVECSIVAINRKSLVTSILISSLGLGYIFSGGTLDRENRILFLHGDMTFAGWTGSKLRNELPVRSQLTFVLSCGSWQARVISYTYSWSASFCFL